MEILAGITRPLASNRITVQLVISAPVLVSFQGKPQRRYVTNRGRIRVSTGFYDKSKRGSLSVTPLPVDDVFQRPAFQITGQVIAE